MRDKKRSLQPKSSKTAKYRLLWASVHWSHRTVCSCCSGLTCLVREWKAAAHFKQSGRVWYVHTFLCLPWNIMPIIARWTYQARFGRKPESIAHLKKWIKVCTPLFHLCPSLQHTPLRENLESRPLCSWHSIRTYSHNEKCPCTHLLCNVKNFVGNWRRCWLYKRQYHTQDWLDWRSRKSRTLSPPPSAPRPDSRRPYL